MNLYRRVESHLCSSVWKFNRKRICRNMKSRLQNTEVSIISMNCTGGILYHDLGLRFLSPTINLYFRADDFIRFCEQLPFYLSLDTLEECKDHDIVGSRKYPVAWLGDVPLFLVHYSSVEEAQRKWNERKQRLNMDNLVILATDRDGMTNELKNRFESLPYNKVMFTHLPDQEHPSCFYLQGYENENSVGIITNPFGWGGRRPVDQFDYIIFFNQCEMRKDEFK